MSNNDSNNQVDNTKVCASKNNNDYTKQKSSTPSSSVYDKGKYGFGF